MQHMHGESLSRSYQTNLISTSGSATPDFASNNRQSQLIVFITSFICWFVLPWTMRQQQHVRFMQHSGICNGLTEVKVDGFCIIIWSFLTYGGLKYSIHYAESTCTCIRQQRFFIHSYSQTVVTITYDLVWTSCGNHLFQTKKSFQLDYFWWFLMVVNCSAIHHLGFFGAFFNSLCQLNHILSHKLCLSVFIQWYKIDS